MKRWFLAIILTCVLVVFGTGSAVLAVGPYPDTADLSVDGLGNIVPIPALVLDSSNGGAGCNQHNMTSYVQWNQLASISQAISTATITFVVSSMSIGTGGDATITIYGTTDNSMPPTGVGSALTSLSCTGVACDAWTTSGTSVVFPTSTGLVNYLNTARTSGGVATFAIRFSTCGTSANVAFEKGSSGITAPMLALFNSNAVTLSTFRAADPTVNWPLIAAALLLVAAVAGFGVYRWRVSQVQAR